MARRRRAGISRPSTGGGASKFFGDPRGIGERVKSAWRLGVLRERKRRGMPLSPGGPSNVGKSVTTVRAHLRKGRTVRQHQRRLGEAAQSLLTRYRGQKKMLGVRFARVSVRSDISAARASGHVAISHKKDSDFSGLTSSWTSPSYHIAGWARNPKRRRR